MEITRRLFLGTTALVAFFPSTGLAGACSGGTEYSGITNLDVAASNLDRTTQYLAIGGGAASGMAVGLKAAVVGGVLAPPTILAALGLVGAGVVVGAVVGAVAYRGFKYVGKNNQCQIRNATLQYR